MRTRSLALSLARLAGSLSCARARALSVFVVVVVVVIVVVIGVVVVVVIVVVTHEPVRIVAEKCALCVPYLDPSRCPVNQPMYARKPGKWH